MSKIKKEKPNLKDFKADKFPIWSKQELYAFNTELEKYRFKKKLITGEEVRLLDFERYMKDKMALNPEGAVYVNNIYPDTSSTVYEVLNEKLNQLYSLISKVEYAKKMEALELDKLSETLTV